MDITFRGLNLGDEDNYLVREIDGWESLPDLTNGSSPLPRRHGSRRGGLLSPKRVVTMEILIDADRVNYDTAARRRELKRVTQTTEDEHVLLIGLGYGDPAEIVYARVTARDIPTRPNYGQLTKAVVEWTATDPRKYSAAIYSASTGLATRPPGRPYPTPPGRFTYASSPGNPGSFQAVNAGEADTLPVFKIRGPISQPTITITDGQGRRVTRFDVALGSREELTIDPREGAVKLNGADRYDCVRGAIVEDLFLRPGVSTVAFGGTSTGSPLLSMEWRDANL